MYAVFSSNADPLEFKAVVVASIAWSKFAIIEARTLYWFFPANATPTAFLSASVILSHCGFNSFNTSNVDFNFPLESSTCIP